MRNWWKFYVLLPRSIYRHSQKFRTQFRVFTDLRLVGPLEELYRKSAAWTESCPRSESYSPFNPNTMVPKSLSYFRVQLTICFRCCSHVQRRTIDYSSHSWNYLLFLWHDHNRKLQMLRHLYDVCAFLSTRWHLSPGLTPSHIIDHLHILTHMSGSNPKPKTSVDCRDINSNSIYLMFHLKMMIF